MIPPAHSARLPPRLEAETGPPAGLAWHPEHGQRHRTVGTCGSPAQTHSTWERGTKQRRVSLIKQSEKTDLCLVDNKQSKLSDRVFHYSTGCGRMDTWRCFWGTLDWRGPFWSSVERSHACYSVGFGQTISYSMHLQSKQGVRPYLSIPWGVSITKSAGHHNKQAFCFKVAQDIIFHTKQLERMAKM